MRRYTVLVVDDSAFMRKIVTDLITEDPGFEVIGTARNGKEAIEKTLEWKPDVITLDVEMPVMNGLDALREIMSRQPTPVVMLSSLTDEGARETIHALELGAIDFVRKPSGSISLDLYKVKDLLLDKMRTAVHARIKRADPPANLVSSATGIRQSPVKSAVKKRSEPAELTSVIAIGTSTGGPKALHALISALPAHLPAAVLVVQHMPPSFTKSLADRLDTVSEMTVTEATDRMPVVPGTVYIAPGGFHMKLLAGLGEYRIALTKEEAVSGHRPSVDVMFESLIPIQDLKRYAVIMTGMGSDGATGMLKMKESGANATIAESEQSCIVYGMPRAAIGLGAVDYIINLPDIADKLINLLTDESIARDNRS